MPPSVGLVITEHATRLDDTARAAYAQTARVLADVAGGTCETVHYLDPLPPADVLVLGGSWSPWALHDQGALRDLGERVVAFDGPVLGICAGMQLLTRFAGGEHAHMSDRRGEHGFVEVDLVSQHPGLDGLPQRLRVFQQHTDEVIELPDELELVASNATCRVQGFVSRERPWWGTQFHPERYEQDTPDGRALIAAFFRSALLE